MLTGVLSGGDDETAVYMPIIRNWMNKKKPLENSSTGLVFVMNDIDYCSSQPVTGVPAGPNIKPLRFSLLFQLPSKPVVLV